jgi:ribonuclease BN (tRNA processing enzyme)
MAFEIWMLGVGDAFSTRHFGTNFLARSHGFTLAIDCPDAYRHVLAHHGVGEAEIDAVFITHLHGDHVNGLEMLLAYRSATGLGPLNVYTTPEVAAELWEHRLRVSLGRVYDGESYRTLELEDFARLHVVDWQSPCTIGPFMLTTRPTRHHIPTAALRLDDGHASLGYSCDTAFDPGLIDWLEDCTLILHESTFGAAHTQLAQLHALPEALREKMRIVHYPDSLIDFEIDGLRFARQGERFGVG